MKKAAAAAVTLREKSQLLRLKSIGLSITTRLKNRDDTTRRAVHLPVKQNLGSHLVCDCPKRKPDAPASEDQNDRS
jgi:hypothetical protein